MLLSLFPFLPLLLFFLFLLLLVSFPFVGVLALKNNLLYDLVYEHYTENNPVEKNTVAGKAAKAKEKELEEWLRSLEGMDRLVDDYVGDKIPLWEKIMDRQGTVCCAWEKTAFEEGLKVGIRLMMEVYSL